MAYLLVSAVALAIGAAAGVLVGRLAAERKTSRAIGELEGQRVRTEQELGTLRQEIHEGESKIEQLNGQLSDRRAEIARLTQTVEEREKSIAEQKQTFEKARETLQETFKALAGDALKSTSTSFLELAQEKLTGILNQTKGDLGKQKNELEALIKPMQDTLKRYEEQLRQLEQARTESYGSLRKHLQSLTETQTALQDRTSQLTMALRNPQARGRWGEFTLQRAVEIAGMCEYCDFHTQVSTDGETGRLRPDMVVQLPGSRRIVVDAKVPCDDYLNAVEASDDGLRKAAFSRYAQAVRGHARQLGAKSYWEQFGSESPEFVVLFLPGESFFSAALAADRDLVDQAMQNRIILASPTTLIALLRAVAFGWRQEKLTRSAEEIREVCAELYDRVLVFTEHLAALGKNLDGSLDAYNKAVGTFQTRIQPTARKLNGLGVSAKREMPEPPLIDRTTRQLPADG